MIGELPPPRRAAHRTFVDADGRPIDDGLALYFPAPASFTGEHVLELHGHGGPVVIALLVAAAIDLGARRAAPGEFSRRAYLNDKLDLAQAEAIADLIESGTAQAARAALRSLSGEFSSAVRSLAEQLTELRVYVEAAIDFPDEEIDFLSDRALQERIAAVDRVFCELTAAASAGRVLRDGFQVAIVGRPNAGKSSLMNRLSGTDAAIVTAVAGTTRDILREVIDLDGLSVELVDTAGLREDPGVIEEEGIRRALGAMAEADAVLWVQDATVAPAADDEPAPGDIPPETPVVVVRNKMDLPGATAGDARSVPVSARTGAGLDDLRERIRTLAGYSNIGEGAFTARRRHIEALERATGHFRSGRQCLEDGRSGELMAEELRLAQAALGEITGEVDSDELLGRIFSSFCIGK
jgi:tRNA modification GTPase